MSKKALQPLLANSGAWVTTLLDFYGLPEDFPCIDTKLTEFGIRDNTLLIFLGDNGTNKGITSRFKGADYKGGKGSTAMNGHHVPLIVSWPAVMKKASVNQDLISCADILPTICQAAGIDTPKDSDGVSFLPELRGETSTPRESIYMWYSPRQNKDTTVSESAFDRQYKLYRTGEFYDLATDPLEKNKLDASKLTDVCRPRRKPNSPRRSTSTKTPGRRRWMKSSRNAAPRARGREAQGEERESQGGKEIVPVFSREGAKIANLPAPSRASPRLSAKLMRTLMP